MSPTPGGIVELAGGRRLAYDDVGDPDGSVVVYLPGCPDSRLTRHPDDSIAAGAGVRLIAVDRPGYGASDPPRDWTRRSMARDIAALVDHLGVASCAVLGWSSGGQVALACTSDPRVEVVGLVAATVPAPFDGDVAAVVDEMLPFVALTDVTHELVREHITEGKSATYLADLDSVAGLLDQLAGGMELAIANGTSGVEFDLRNLMTPWDFALDEIETKVVLWYGTHDDVVAPALGEHLAQDLSTSSLRVVDDASHLLMLTHWTQILESLRKEPACR
jgi:pimeloyl-ACP methyl ester carboxylesterase